MYISSAVDYARAATSDAAHGRARARLWRKGNPI